MLAAVGSPSYEGFTKNKTADQEANKISKLNEENRKVILAKNFLNLNFLRLFISMYYFKKFYKTR